MIRSRAVSSLNGVLFLVALGIASWLRFVPQRPAGAATAPGGVAPGPGQNPCEPGLFLDFLTNLGIDYVNDGSPPPHAFSVTSGVLAPVESARFRLYAIEEGFAYADVTPAFLHPRPCPAGSPSGKVIVRAAPGSGSVAGTIRTVVEDGAGEVIYTPKRTATVDRTALIEFRYKIPRPFSGIYSKVFSLTIQGVPPGAPRARD